MQRQIVDAIRDGFGDAPTKVRRTVNRHALVDVDGFPSPIVVQRRGDVVRVPECFPPEIAAGIRLDVQTIRAGY